MTVGVLVSGSIFLGRSSSAHCVLSSVLAVPASGGLDDSAVRKHHAAVDGPRVTLLGLSVGLLLTVGVLVSGSVFLGRRLGYLAGHSISILFFGLSRNHDDTLSVVWFGSITSTSIAAAQEVSKAEIILFILSVILVPQAAEKTAEELAGSTATATTISAHESFAAAERIPELVPAIMGGDSGGGVEEQDRDGGVLERLLEEHVEER